MNMSISKVLILAVFGSISTLSNARADLHFQAGPSLGLASGGSNSLSTVWGGMLGADAQITEMPIRVGLLSGFTYSSTSTPAVLGISASATAFSVPILATGIYELKMDSLTPYFGAAGGVHIATGSVTISGPGSKSSSTSTTSVASAFFGRAGLRFDPSNRYGFAFEVQPGVLSGSFVTTLHAAMVFFY